MPTGVNSKIWPGSGNMRWRTSGSGNGFLASLISIESTLACSVGGWKLVAGWLFRTAVIKPSRNERLTSDGGLT